MKTGDERRHEPRRETPHAEDGAPRILLSIPDLSKKLLAPENYSRGGLHVTLDERPGMPSPPVSCSLMVDGAKVNDFEAQVKWVQQNEGAPPTWTAGLSVDAELDIL